MTPELLREAREAIGLSQSELGKYIGHSRANVANMEMGRAPIDAEACSIMLKVISLKRTLLDAAQGKLEQVQDLEHMRNVLDNGAPINPNDYPDQEHLFDELEQPSV